MLEPLNGPVIDWSGISGSAMNQWTVTGAGEFTVDGWLRVPVNRNGDTVRMFVNGEEIDPNGWVQLELPLEGN